MDAVGGIGVRKKQREATDHLKLKTRWVSSRSLVRHWKQAGTAGEIPGYATHIERVSRASKVIKAGGVC